MKTKREFKEQLFTTSGISKSYMQIRESIDLDKYAEKDCKPFKRKTILPKPVLMLGIGLGSCAAVAVGVIGISQLINSRSNIPPQPSWTRFEERVYSYEEFATKVEQYTENDEHGLKDYPLHTFEITSTFGYESCYVISGTCFCPPETREEAHKDGVCPNFSMIGAEFYYLENITDQYPKVSIEFGHEETYDKDNLYWEECDYSIISGKAVEGYYILLDKSDVNSNYLISIHTHDQFALEYINSLKEEIFNHFKNK